MPLTSEYDNIVKEFAEGSARKKLEHHSKTAIGALRDLPIFYRYVIIDVIFDPSIIDDAKLLYWRNTLNVLNMEHAAAAPPNSIIAKRIIDNTSTIQSAVVLYPFVTHMSVPAKPGEHVWVMFENPTGTNNDLGYWLWKIAGPSYVEDVNHTHPHRAFDPSFSTSAVSLATNTVSPKYEFRNGSVSVENGERYTVAETASIIGPENIYEQLIKTSDAGLLSHNEAVPRYRKRPSDWVIEGSNNTLIVLGRDRTGPVASYIEDTSRGNIPTVPDADMNLDGAGSIDLVAGRGQTPVTGGTPVTNSLNYQEIGKAKSEVSPNEGDPDFSTDRSRVLISQRTNVDSNFKLLDYNINFTGGTISGEASETTAINDSPDGDGAIVIKTDKIRFIARSDVELLVTGYERDDNGNMRTIEDTSKWSALVIKTNGDIVLRPAEQGYVKLGGDDADRGIVCSDTPVLADNGIVSTQPLITTAGGAYATGKTGQGQISTKVLVKG